MAKHKKEVNQKVIDLKIALQKGINIAARNDTFEDWTKSWLTIKKAKYPMADICVIFIMLKNTILYFPTPLQS